jgi:hypothetical protein
MLNVSRRQNRRVSTKLESLAQAEDFAEDWYLELRGKHRAGELKSEKTFRDAAAQHVMDVMRLQHLDVRGIGTETVFGHNHLEIGVILTERAALK